jgi:hypothetical protein
MQSFSMPLLKGEGRNWEVRDRTQAFGWRPATLYLAGLYAQPTRWAVRRKTTDQPGAL